MFAAIKKFLYPESEDVRVQGIKVDEAMAALQDSMRKNEETIQILMRRPDPFRKLAMKMAEE